jgi:hypothetical protein
MKRLPSPRCASTIQIVRPLESIAETQLDAFQTAADAVKAKLSPKDAEWFETMIYKREPASLGKSPETPTPTP